MSNASDFVIENSVLIKYVGPGGDVVIPDGVISIGDGVVPWCRNLTNVVIPESVTSINACAFWGCSSLTNVEIPDSVTFIGVRAFDGCSSLKSVVIPKKVTSISDCAFSKCSSMTNVVISAGVTSIDHYAFEGCSNLIHVKIPDGVTYIGRCAFKGCSNMNKVEIPESITCIDKSAFSNCKSLTGVLFPVHLVPFIGTAELPIHALRIRIADLSVLPTKYRISAALCFAEEGGLREDIRFESHGKYLKANSGRIVETAVRNPRLLMLLCKEKWIAAKDIEAYQSAVQQTKDAELIAMLLNYSENNLTVKAKEKIEKQLQKQEDTVLNRTIARMTKDGISGLNFVVAGNLRTFQDKKDLRSFIENKGGKLMSAVSSKTDYLIMNDSDTNSEKKKKAQELGVEVITEDQFNDKTGRSFRIRKNILIKYLVDGMDVVIPEGVTCIGDQAFAGCSSLVNVKISESVASIGKGAFRWCNSLSNVVLTENVTSIGKWAFNECNSVTIHAPAGSYAETYAKENKIPFAAE